jgi:hypothetical protein
MKTKLLLAAAFFGLAATSKAQTILYSNDFSATAGLNIIDADGDTNVWGLYNSNATTIGWGLVGGFAGSESWSDGALTPDNYLFTTNAIDIPDSFAATTLSLVVGCTNTQFAGEHFGVWLVPAENNTAPLITAYCEANPAQIEMTLDPDYAQTVTPVSADVTSFNGASVRIIVRHFDTFDMELLYIDDILLSQELLGTEQFASSKFSVFPNPASNVINVSAKTSQTITGVAIADLNGRIVLQTSFDSLSNAQLNIADLSTGVYTMTIKSAEGETVKKIVKK